MRIAVFGATGGTGRQFVQQALAVGHQINALARTPSKLAAQQHPQLKVIQGDVQEAHQVEATLKNTEAVVCMLGTTPNNPDMIVSMGTRTIIQAMQRLGQPRRLLVLTSLGVGSSQGQVPLAFRMLMRTVLKKAMEDKEEQERLVQESNLDWIIVRPGGLTDEPARGEYRHGLDPRIMAGRIPRSDVAAFLLQQLTDDTYLRQTPAIA